MYRIFSVLLFLLTVYRVESATYNAATPNYNDVWFAITNAPAVDGDLVNIPAGTASWTNTLSITNGITIAGAGIGVTIILDDVPLNPSTGAAQNIKGVFTPGQKFRLTGITFRKGTKALKALNGVIGMNGITAPTGSIHIDHCEFDQHYNDSFIQFFGWIYGCIDHCIFEARKGAGMQSILVEHTQWGGGANNYGDGSWAEPAYYGTEKAIYMEDNQFVNLGTAQTNGGLDCYGGGRYVARFNSFSNTVAVNHGTESPGRLRSSRSMEIYGNNFFFTFSATVGQSRGGGLLLFSNAWTGPSLNAIYNANVYREFWPFHTFGGAYGANPYDVNDPHGVYITGTHTGTNGSPFLNDSTASWTNNGLFNMMVVNNTQLVGANNEHYCSFITNNTSTNIFFHRDPSFGTTMFFSTGDSYSIYGQIRIALDQCGRGSGDLLSGNPALPATWPNQVQEPLYCWNNLVNGNPVSIGSIFPTETNGVDYINSAMPGYTIYAYPHPLVSGIIPPPPVPWTLTITSVSSGGTTPVTISPADVNGLTNGMTTFTCLYSNLVTVTISVPTNMIGNPFVKWVKDGADYSLGSVTNVLMNANHTLQATYLEPPPIIPGALQTIRIIPP